MHLMHKIKRNKRRDQTVFKQLGLVQFIFRFNYVSTN